MLNCLLWEERIRRSVSNLDQFSRPVTLLVNQKERYKTGFGGCLFLIVIVLTLTFFGYSINRFFSFSEFTQSQEIQKGLNVTLKDRDEYFLMLAAPGLNIYLPSLQSVEKYKNLDRFVQFKLEKVEYDVNGTYTYDINLTQFEVDFSQPEPCLSFSDILPTIGTYKQSTGNISEHIYTRSFCPSSTTTNIEFVHSTFVPESWFFRITIERCQQNPSKSCATSEEIDEFIKEMEVYVVFVDFDPQRRIPLSSKKHTEYYQRQIRTTFKPESINHYTFFFRPTHLVTDSNILYSSPQTVKGMSFEDYKPEYYKYNDKNTVGRVLLSVGWNTEIRTFTYPKITDIFIKTNGIFQTLFGTALVVASIYSSFVLYEWLINSFANTTNKDHKYAPVPLSEIRKSQTNPTSQKKEDSNPSRRSLRFKFWSHFVPSLVGVDRFGFSDMKKSVDGYRDLQWIIDKLHQIEILKRILLTKKQIALMERIPKTEIVEMNKDGNTVYAIQDKLWTHQSQPELASKEEIEQLINQLSREERNDTRIEHILQLLEYKGDIEDPRI
eukprot:TRINITY_DN5074_c0_g1_i4.p1 TRINITY_DN5074_c0_g1~~TRINITY_DN5074_c0_g1_i4.p1  ORF type:complete len:551 (+),score=47.82 TRINITY_DN5074_c0_g1_i4:76-1728(+)